MDRVETNTKLQAGHQPRAAQTSGFSEAGVDFMQTSALPRIVLVPGFKPTDRAGFLLVQEHHSGGKPCNTGWIVSPALGSLHRPGSYESGSARWPSGGLMLLLHKLVTLVHQIRVVTKNYNLLSAWCRLG